MVKITGQTEECGVFSPETCRSPPGLGSASSLHNPDNSTSTWVLARVYGTGFSPLHNFQADLVFMVEP